MTISLIMIIHFCENCCVVMHLSNCGRVYFGDKSQRFYAAIAWWEFRNISLRGGLWNDVISPFDGIGKEVCFQFCRVIFHTGDRFTLCYGSE